MVLDYSRRRFPCQGQKLTNLLLAIDISHGCPSPKRHPVRKRFDLVIGEQ